MRGTVPKWCPCKRGLLNHSIYHDLGNGHSQWMKIRVIIKSVSCDFHTKQISCFICGILLGIYRGYCIVQGKQIWQCDCSIVSCASCVNPNMFFHSVAFKSKYIASKLSPSQSILAKILQEVGDEIFKIKQLLHIIPLGFSSFLILSSLHTYHHSGDQSLRGYTPLSS